MIIKESVDRTEGRSKAIGRARYVDDLELPGVWFGATLRSAVPHAKIRRIHFEESFDWDSVVVVDHRRIPGENVVLFHDVDQPCLAVGVVRHVGEPILLVAAPERALARAAVAAIQVEYEELPAALTIEDALQGDVVVREGGNVQAEIRLVHGDVDAAFAQAARVVEGVYHTGRQEQLYLEPQGMLAVPQEEGVRIAGSLQCPFFVRPAVARMLGVPEERVVVEQAETGGGFGGKEEFPSMVACHAALLARVTGQPVKMIYRRDEDLVATTKRHPARIHLRHAVDGDGRILALEGELLLDGGAYVTLSPVVLSRAVIHAGGPYRIPAARIVGRTVATNNLPSGAFRGFGAPQAIFAAERQMDRIARELGLDPVEVRRRNMLRLGDRTLTGQVLRESVGLPRVFERALEASGYEQRRAAYARERGPVRRGIGLSLSYHGCAFTGGAEEHIKGTAGVRLTPDGGAEVLAASTEIGQGSRTIFRQIAAEALGLPLERVTVASQNTCCVPNSGPTVASRTTTIVGGLVQQVCEDLVAELEAFCRETGAADLTRSEQIAALVAARGEVTRYRTYKNPPGVHWDPETYHGDAYPCYSYKCDVAEVEVDLDTYEVRVVRHTAVADIGTVIHPLQAEGQMEGGILQGIGLATIEDCRIEGGRVVQDRMATAIVPTSMDAPEFQILFEEEPYPLGAFGAKGLGELPVNGVPPAVAAAVDQAAGVFVERIPILPDVLMRLRGEGAPREEEDPGAASGEEEQR